MIRVGLQFDLRNPPAWQRPWTSLYSTALDDIVDAERQGVDFVWLTEHHMFEDGYLPQPFTFAATLGPFVSEAASSHPIETRSELGRHRQPALEREVGLVVLTLAFQWLLSRSNGYSRARADSEPGGYGRSPSCESR